MKYTIILLACLPALAQPSAREVLDRMAAAYAHISTIHVVAERSDAFASHGRSGSVNSQCELAASGRNLYYVRLKRDGQEAVAVSDGDNTWKALPSKKQWSLLAAASTGAEEGAGSAESRDLHGFVAATLFGQYPSIARIAENPVLERDEEVKVHGTKIPCFVVRADAENAQYEFWIDRERFVVLQSKMRAESRGEMSETKIRTVSIDINPQLPSSQFQFEPGKAWSQVDMLLLPGEDRLLLTGSRAANFALKTLDGESVSLDQSRGKVVVLDFWATWCPPCRKEMPSIERLRAEFGDRVQFYGVNDEESGKVKDFVKKNHYDMTVLMDGKRQVHRQYGVSAIPTLLVVDKNGVIRQHFIGSREESTLRKAIQSVLTAN